jgi:hypothetical protein
MNQDTLNDILKLLAQTKEEITRRLAPARENVPHRDVRGDVSLGEADYANAMITYIKEVEATRQAFDPALTHIAGKISTLGGKGWKKNDDIVQAWLALAHVVQELRHNPEKGPAAVYVSNDNKLIAFAASNFWLDEMQPSEKLQRKHLTYDKGRTALNICAEPAAIAKVVGHDKLRSYLALRSFSSIKKHKGKPLSGLSHQGFCAC